ncbi:hypothetical protein D3C86_1047290 [compost metagenome]
MAGGTRRRRRASGRGEPAGRRAGPADAGRRCQDQARGAIPGGGAERAARRHSRQGHRRTDLRPRRARAGHAARPGGASALCGARQRRLRRHQPDRGGRIVDRQCGRRGACGGGGRLHRRGGGARRTGHRGGPAAQGALEAGAGVAGSRRAGSRLACRPGPAAGIARHWRRAGGTGGRHPSPDPYLRVAISDAWVHRPVLRRGGLARQPSDRVVRYAEPACAADRHGAAQWP